MRKAAELLRQRAEHIALLMTLEQGKPLVESHAETALAAETIEWFAEEARRTYGRIVPSRTADVLQMVIKEPVGPVAAFTPWDFSLNQTARKLRRLLRNRCNSGLSRATTFAQRANAGLSAKQ